MLRRCLRTLTKNGNSRTIAIPGSLRANLGWFTGQLFDVTHDNLTGVVTLRAISQAEAAAIASSGRLTGARCVRVLTKNGNCRTVALPHSIVNRRLWQAGQPFELTFDSETTLVTLRALGEPQDRGLRGGYTTRLREVSA